MIALKIKDIKNFMNKLLNSDTFDSYLLEEATIQTFNTFSIDGNLNKGFYSDEERDNNPLLSSDYSPWELIKPIIFQIIKGKNVPSLLKISLLLSPSEGTRLLENNNLSNIIPYMKYFVIIIRYDSNGLRITSGTSFSSFIFDKAPDILWDNTLKEFLMNNSIDFDII